MLDEYQQGEIYRMAKRSRRRRSQSTAAVEEKQTVDLAAEYHYVIEDLERIGIIAAILIAGLVVLSFFI
jgi:hypothetical protein